MIERFGFRWLLVLTLLGPLVLRAQTPPTFSSTPVTTGVYDQPYAYFITTTDAESDTREITLTSGPLPVGISLTDHGDGTATLSGNLGQVGSFPIELTVQEVLDGSQSAVQQFTIEVDKATPVVNWDDPADIIFGTSLNAVQLNATADVAGSFIYTPAFGALLDAGDDQVLSVDFFPNDPSLYHSVLDIEVLITVARATPVVSWINPSDISYGTPLGNDQLNATSDVAGTFIYTPPATTVLPVGDNQILMVSFYPSNSINYNPVEDVQRNINVKQGIPLITWPTPSDITYGTPLGVTQLNATADVPGTFIYTPPLGTVLNAGSNQVLSADFTPTDLANYAPVDDFSVLITVDKATPIITWVPPDPIRVNEPLSVTQLNASASVAGSFTYTPAAGSSYPAIGTYTLSADFIPADINNYHSVLGTELQIDVTEKDNPVVSWANADDITYGTPLTATQLNATASIPGTFAYNPPLGTLLNAGSNQVLEVTFTPTDAVNYNQVTRQVFISVSKIMLTATADATTRNYGESNPVFGFTYSGFVNGEDATVLTSVPTFASTALPTSPVGIYTISGSGGVDENYDFTYIGASLTINKATLTVTAISHSRSYGTANPTLGFNYAGFANGENDGVLTSIPTVSTSATSMSNVGTYPILVSGGSAANYDFVHVNGLLTVSKAILTVTADNKGRVYGVANPALTATYSGFVNGEGVDVLTVQPSLNTVATIESGIGTYPIQVGGGTDDNYDFAYVLGSLSIGKAILTVTALNQARPYGAPNPVLSVTYSGFVNGENATALSLVPVASTTAIVSSDAGTYAIQLSTGAATNYDIIYVPGVLTVNKAVLTVTAQNQSKAYGSAMPPLAFSYSGFIAGEDETVLGASPSVSTLANSASDAGTYPIVVTGGLAANYQFNYVAGTLTVEKANLSVVVNNINRSYGSPNPVFTPAYSGFVNGEDSSVLDAQPVASTVAVSDSDVGNYPITLSGGTDNNYHFIFSAGTLTITKAILTITAVSQTRFYGTANGPLQLTFTGFADGENAAVLNVQPTVSTPANATSLPGSYPIVVFGALDNNYDFSYASGTLTVAKAPLIVAATSQERFYRSPNPPLAFTFQGFVNGEGPTSLTNVPVISTAANLSSSAGSYPITVAGGVSDKYEFNYQNGVMLVKKVDLTVTASNQSRVYGQSNPTLTFSYSGFVSGETTTELTNLPVAGTIANPTSPVGTYPIVLSSGAAVNYNFVYVNAFLTITKATVLAKARDYQRTYGLPNPVFSIEYSGFINGETADVLDVPPNISTTATINSHSGVYQLLISGGNDNNYSYTYQPGLLTIDKALLTARADDKFRLVGEANPPLTVTYTGFMNQEDVTVLDNPPVVSTTATVASLAGLYAIEINGGEDNNYIIEHVNGTLTVNALPMVGNSLVSVLEDTEYHFSLSDFSSHFSDNTWDAINVIRIVRAPVHGILTLAGQRLQDGNEIIVQGGNLSTLIYLANNNYNGGDSLVWNASDGISFAAAPATLSLDVQAVNDPPTLHNLELVALVYSPGGEPIRVTEKLVINDVDNSSVFSATVKIAENFRPGDLLSLPASVKRDVEAVFHVDKGELEITGKDSRSNYEKLLTSILFSSTVDANPELIEKQLTLVVTDSLSASLPATRFIKITETFPDIEIVNSFTPNDDGVNDYWDFLNMNYYEAVRISIFDSSGVRVFECDQPDCRWDGRQKGSILPAGPYFYTIDLNNGKRKYQGLVNILR